MNKSSSGSNWLPESIDMIYNGQEITQLNDGSIRLALLPGDGIGRDVAAAVLTVIQRINQMYGDLIAVQLIPTGAEYFQETGDDIADGGIEACRNADVILLGASGMPDATTGHQIEMPGGKFAGWTPLVGNRKNLDLYANVRPITTYRGLQTRISGKYHVDLWPAGLDIIIIRENTEDLYCGIGGIFERAGIAESAIDARLTTVKGVERIAHFAFKMARERQAGRGNDRKAKVSCIAKTNVLEGCKLFTDVFNTVAKEYPDIATEHLLVDAFAQCILRKPEIFDVVVTSNMFGDIVTEVASVVQGGMGIATGCNIGEDHAMFEPIHGSAPNMAGKGLCNPIAMIAALAEAMLWIGKKNELPEATESGRGIQKAIAKVIKLGKTLSYDIVEGKHASTDEVAQAVADAL